MPIRLGNGALRHHADLRTAADHDDALAVDALEGRHGAHLRDPFQSFDVGHQPSLVRRAGDLELKLGHGLPMRPSGDVAHVPTVPEDGFGYSIEHTRRVSRRHKQTQNLGFGHAQKDSAQDPRSNQTVGASLTCPLRFRDRYQARGSTNGLLLPAMLSRPSSKIGIEISRGGPPT